MSLADGDTPVNSTALVFLPVEVIAVQQIFLHGEIETYDSTVSLYVTGTCQKRCKRCIGVCSTVDRSSGVYVGTVQSSWFHLERDGDGLTLKRIKLRGECLRSENFGVVVVYYDRKRFIQCENSLFMKENLKICKRDHFRRLIQKLRCQNNRERKSTFFMQCMRLLQTLRWVFVFLSMCSKKLFCIAQYSEIAVHFDNYLTGLIWLSEPPKKDRRQYIKRLNFTLSILTDFLLGAICLGWLTSHFSSESLPQVFTFADSIVKSLRDLIHWLTGDPAGFKLNYTFSKILATFFLFYIDVWCAFIALVKPAYKSIYLIFLVLGRGGITFQVSIIADILAIVTLHINCICLFAARLYNIQITALIALWRLFLGRKKNPLRGRVDSCKYTPEQLFIGTLGFTILLFLLPTTLMYYIVFTTFRVILTAFTGTLRGIRYHVHSLQIYSTVLWLMRSPKVCQEIHLIPCAPPRANSCLIFHVKPVCTSWKETILHDRLDFMKEPVGFKFVDFLYSLLIGSVKQS